MAHLLSDPTIETPIISQLAQFPSAPLGISVPIHFFLSHSQSINTAFLSHVVLALFSPDFIQQIPVDRGSEPFPFLPVSLPNISILCTVIPGTHNQSKDPLLDMTKTLQGFRETNFFTQYIELLNSMELQDEEAETAMFASVVQHSVVPYMNLLLQIKQEIKKAGEGMQTTFAFVEKEAEAIQTQLEAISAGHEELSKL